MATYNWASAPSGVPPPPSASLKSARTSGSTSPTKAAATAPPFSPTSRTDRTSPTTTPSALRWCARRALTASYTDQANQDWGHHEIVFGIAGHNGDWRAGQTDWQGYRLNAPLIAFESPKHAGRLGKQFSLVKIDNPRIRIMAMKKAENSDEVILRMVEMSGQAQPRRARDLRRAGDRRARSQRSGIAGGRSDGCEGVHDDQFHRLPAAHVRATNLMPAPPASRPSVRNPSLCHTIWPLPPTTTPRPPPVSTAKATRFPPKCFPRI